MIPRTFTYRLKPLTDALGTALVSAKDVRLANWPSRWRREEARGRFTKSEAIQLKAWAHRHGFEEGRHFNVIRIEDGNHHQLLLSGFGA